MHECEILTAVVAVAEVPLRLVLRRGHTFQKYVGSGRLTLRPAALQVPSKQPGRGQRFSRQRKLHLKMVAVSTDRRGWTSAVTDCVVGFRPGRPWTNVAWGAELSRAAQPLQI